MIPWRIMRRLLCGWVSCGLRNFATATGDLHTPVLAREVVYHLHPKPGQVFVDMTFGAGGHTKALLCACPDITVFCLDQDRVAFELANTLAKQRTGKLIPLLGRFSELEHLLEVETGSRVQVDGVIMDLGASSMQMDSPDRGFGVNRDAFLDMRMSGTTRQNQPTAADAINNLSAAQLAHIFKVYGEESFARRIANVIVEHRSVAGPVQRTHQLADLIASVVAPAEAAVWGRSSMDSSVSTLGRGVPSQPRQHAATRVFQALRIFINNELNELCSGLETAFNILRPGGRATVISFHSLEDRLVKWAFTNPDLLRSSEGLARQLEAQSMDGYVSWRRKNLLNQIYHEPTQEIVKTSSWFQVGGVILPSNEEMSENRRSRSAKLRVAEKTSN